MLVLEVLIKGFISTVVQIWMSLDAAFLLFKSVKVYSIKNQYLWAYMVAVLGKTI